MPNLKLQRINFRTLRHMYRLPLKYFIISNQFWIHKDYPTAFKALRKLKTKFMLEEIHFVCTGKTDDYRFPHYFLELQKMINKLNLEQNIHILGYIPKHDQLQIMSHSLALVQPTLFEGSPGACATQDAISLGVPVIASNIPVNKEITGQNIIFFSKGSSTGLATAMYKVVTRPPRRPLQTNLTRRNDNQLRTLGKALYKCIVSEIDRFNDINGLHFRK